jgi:hypothetical protein
LKARQGIVFDTLRRIQNWLTASDATLGTPLISTTTGRQKLDGLVTQMSTAADSQAAGKVNAKNETANQRNLRLALRLDHMRPIAHVAKATLKDVPQFSALVMPPSDMSAANLVPYANGMAQAAQQYAQVFTSNGLPADFVAQLQAAAAAVRASIDTRATSIAQKVNAAGSLKDDETQARAVIKLLDGIVLPRISKNAGMLAAWKSVKRISAKPGVPTGVTAAATAADAVTQAAASTSTSAATSPSSSTTTSPAAPAAAPATK